MSAQKLTHIMLDLKNQTLQRMRSSQNFAFSLINQREIEEKVQLYEAEFTEKYFEKFISKNIKESQKKCHRELLGLWQFIDQKLHKDAYDMGRINDFEMDIRKLIASYTAMGE